MTTQNIALFKAIGAKMSYLNERQRVLSQNIANVDTPGYQPHDLSDVDFGRILEKISGGGILEPAATSPRHLPTPGAIGNAENREQKVSYEIKPMGNAVVMEEQLIKAARTQIDYNLMTTLYQKSVSMIHAALGRG